MPPLPVVGRHGPDGRRRSAVSDRAAPSRGRRRGHRWRTERAGRGRRGANGLASPFVVLDAARGRRGRGDLRRADDRRPDRARHAPRPCPRDRRRDGGGRDPAGLPRQRPGRARDRARGASTLAGVAWTSGRDRAPPTACRATRRRSPRPVRRRRTAASGPSSPQRSATGAETTTPADTVVVGLGLAPRDSWRGWPAPCRSTVGRRCRRRTSRFPRHRPRASSAAAWARPSRTSPTPGTAATRSSSCSSAPARPASARARAAPACRNVRSWIAAKSGQVPEPFTARPASRQITLAEAAADALRRRLPARPRSTTSTSPLGARMDRFGGWWRPWHYGDAVAEYWAVREGVSIGDVQTLGKLVVSGPDVVELLERLYPCHVADIKPGRSRYALLLNERGHVMDDGMILRESETRFVLTFTSGGAANAEMWIRDWIDAWGLRVHVLDRTMSLAAINVTGPLAGTLLNRAGLADPPRFLGHVRADVAGVPCHVMRLSFTGEAAFELHHPVDRSVELWRALLRPRRRPGHPAARASGAVRASAREGPRHRRDGHRARHDAAPARDGLGGQDGQAALHRPGLARADGQAPRPPPLGRLHDGRPGARRGRADLVGRRGRRQRDGSAGTRRCSARP